MPEERLAYAYGDWYMHRFTPKFVSKLRHNAIKTLCHSFQSQVMITGSSEPKFYK